MPDTTPQAHVERELIRLVRRYRVAMTRHATAVHPDLDVAGYNLLLAVVDAEGESEDAEIRVAALEERLRLHKSTLSRGLAQLEAMGLVHRVSDPSDARTRLVRLTHDGRERLERVRSERRAVLEQVLHEWPAADLTAFGDALGRLNVDLERAVSDRS